MQSISISQTNLSCFLAYHTDPLYSLPPHLSILRSNQATFSGNEARNNTTVTTHAVTNHDSKKIARIGGKSGRKVLEGSRSGLASGAIVVGGMVEVAKRVGILCSAAAGV